MSNLLTQAKAELARWAKIVELLEAAPSMPAASSSKPKKANTTPGRAFWTPQRRAEMSRKMKALQKSKKKKAQPPKPQGEK